jgi:acyl-coenzyme A synthetase/AMP-(fatty) acid ligase
VGSAAPLQFDFSTLDWGLALGSGAALVQVPAILVHQSHGFLDYLDEKAVTVMSGVPSIWRSTLAGDLNRFARLKSLRTILYGGEAFSVQEINRFHRARNSLRIVNTFGQSESIACSFYDLKLPLDESLTRVPFGQAYPGAEILLIDENGDPVTQRGVVGEVCVRGTSLFNGYWKDEAATARALIPNPLRTHSGETVFRSGDLASAGNSGEFYFHGRKDLQIKLNGNRIEPEEIENWLLALEGVRHASVLLITEDGTPQLTAFVEADPGRVSAGMLRAHCARKLPRYMLPSAFVVLDRLPIQSTGKVDRAALRRMGGLRTAAATAAVTH